MPHAPCPMPMPHAPCPMPHALCPIINMKPYRRFHLILLGMVSASSLLVAGFNAVIDPFGVTNSPRIRGLNRVKPETVDNTRLYKAIDLTRQNAKTILLGASRVETALNPNHPAFNAHQPVYNLGIASATVYEQRRYLEHAIATQQNIELVILGIDLWLIPEPYLKKSGFEEARLGKEVLSLREALQINFSLDTLNKSIATIRKNRQYPDYIYYHPNGVRDVGYIKNIKFTAWLPGVINNKNTHLYPPALENIKIIRDLCKKQGIELKVFITPPHVTQFEGMYIDQWNSSG